MPPFLALITPIGNAGSGLPYPDNTLPIPQPPFPTQPQPPVQPPRPDNTLPLFPFNPIVVPPGGSWPTPPGVPTPPIVLPPDLPPTLPPPDSRPVDWKTAWTPQTGWIVIGIPTGPVPTPSA